MDNHVAFMIHLTQQLAEEERVRARIAELRLVHANNGKAQLDLDRHDRFVADREKELRNLMHDIASRN